MLRVFLRGRCVSSSKSIFASRRQLQLSSCNFSSALEELKTKERSLAPEQRPPKMRMEPYVKNMFHGIIDPHVFAYPELDQGSLNIVQEMKEEIERFMCAENFSTFSSDDKISAETISKLKELGLFKLNIPQQYGGMELTCAEMLRLCEALYKVPSLFHTLNAHLQYVSPLFSNFASEEQKEKYLPSLASGDLQIGFALWEENIGTDVSKLNCTASFQGDKYILSGTKTWVCNGGIADKFLVFANEQKSNLKEVPDTITCFLVDKHAEGITATSMETLGVTGYNAWEVKFDKTIVPKENVIGVQGQGLSIIKSLLYGKFTLAGACTGLLRDLLNTTINHAINKETFGKPLIENDIIKQHLAEAAARLYALESIAYMTADFYDNIEDPDIEVEVAIVKIFSCETSLFVLQKCLSVLGSDAYLKNKPYERILRDIYFTPLVETSVDTLRMTIALLGLKHVGSNLQNKVLLKRNPLLFPKEAFKYLVQRYISDEDKVPGFRRLVFENVHPTLEVSADLLEKAILKFGFATDETLTKWGAQIVSSQVNLARLADIAINLYASTAVLARSSRSISIGLRNCDTDIFVNNIFAQNAQDSLSYILNQLRQSPYGTNDSNCEHIVKALVHERRYHAAHPLSRNF